jgi:hypothetical protein
VKLVGHLPGARAVRPTTGDDTRRSRKTSSRASAAMRFRPGVAVRQDGVYLPTA